MKILFIIKDFIVEPLGIMYLSKVLKLAGHRVDVVKGDTENVEDKVKEFSPDIIAYSIMTGDHIFFRDLNLKLKDKFKFIAIFGGSHPTFFNEFINEKGVDIICLGEGEEAIVELADRLEKGKSFADIPNLWIKDKEKIIKNPIRSLADIDSIPFPDRELLYSKYPRARNNRIKNFIGVRGCPYNCSFCYNHRLQEIYRGKGQYARTRSADNLIQEILELKNKYPLEVIYFQDDTFGIDINWMEEFSKKYKKIINVPFHCNQRADLLTEKKVGLLKEAGCFGVSVAIEAANDYLRNQVLEKNITKEHILRAIKFLKKAGLRIRTYNILGIPNGSLKDDFETLKLNILLKPDLPYVTIYQPYPGTKLGDLCIKKGLYDGDYDKILESSYFGESPLKIPNRNRINNLHKLFNLTVSFPFLVPITKILINLPPNALFEKIHSFWRGRLNERLYKT